MDFCAGLVQAAGHPDVASKAIDYLGSIERAIAHINKNIGTEQHAEHRAHFPIGFQKDAEDAPSTLCIFNLSREVSDKDLRESLKGYPPVIVLKQKFSSYGLVQFRNHRDTRSAKYALQVLPLPKLVCMGNALCTTIQRDGSNITAG